MIGTYRSGSFTARPSRACCGIRLSEAALDTTVEDLKLRAECMARESVLDLASFLDNP